MARPSKPGLDYFPLDSDFYNSPLMRMVLRSQGKEGMAFLLCLKAEIFRENGIYLTLDESMLCKLEIDTDTDREDILRYVESFIDRGVFHRELYEKFHILTSEEIQRIYCEAVRTRARHRRIIVPKRFWLLPPEETPDYIDAGNRCSPPKEKTDAPSVEVGGMILPSVRCISDDELEARKREMIKQINDYYRDKD